IAAVGSAFPLYGPLTGLTVAVSMAIALTVVCLAYLAAIVALHRRVATTRGAAVVVVSCMLLFQLTLVLMPGVFSTDVFSYVAYGQLAGVHGLNPVVMPPAALTGNPILQWIYPDWQQLPSPYGPLWTALSASMAPALQSLDAFDQVM